MIFKRGQAVTASDMTDIFRDIILRANNVSDMVCTAGQVYDYGFRGSDVVECEPYMSTVEQYYRSTVRPEYISNAFGFNASIDSDRYLEYYVDELEKIKERKRNG